MHLNFLSSKMDITPKVFKTNYETTFIVVPELSESEQREVSDKFINLIKENGGEVTNIEQWGLRKLAYPINAKYNGYYTFVEFTALGELIHKLEREYGYDEKVLRFLTVKLDKHAVAYNQKRREHGFGMRKESEAKK